MENLGNLSSKIADWARRCAERADTPEFQANAEKLRAEITATEAQSQEAARKLALHEAGIPQALWETLRAPKETPAFATVRDWLAGPRECVFLALAGPAGRGKTFAAASAVAEWSGLYAIAHDLVTVGMFNPGWIVLGDAPLVALDELGNEHMNDAYRASLYAVLNKRHARQYRTVLVTNLDAAAFRDRYCPDSADPLRDRLRTASRWENLPGESMRTHWAETEPEDEEREHAP